VHVLNNQTNVTRYQNTRVIQPKQSNFFCATAGLTVVNQALIVGSSTSSGGGTAYAGGWRCHFNSTTQAATDLLRVGTP
jgi:hypothetical protein